MTVFEGLERRGYFHKGVGLMIEALGYKRNRLYKKAALVSRPSMTKMMTINKTFLSGLFGAAFIFAIILSTSGCASTHKDRATGVEAYEVRNFTAKPLPADMRRVVLLPIVIAPDLGVAASLEAIKRSLTEELGKVNKFEVIALDEDAMREWSGVSYLTSLDVWPDRLRQSLLAHQVDGVMLVEVTQLRGYPPLVLGLKTRLVAVKDAETYWACDETFDAAVPAVFSGAKHFEGGMLLEMGKIKGVGSIDMSPAEFAKYAGYEVFKTLPK
jgi:hypothetical protein